MRKDYCSHCFAPIEKDKCGRLGRRRFCFDCCAERDKEQMRKTGKIVLYLEERKFLNGFTRYVTNFPGSLEIPAFGKTGKHNIAGERVDVNFSFEGTHWHGVRYGRNSQLCYCRRLKPKTFEEEARMAYQPLFAEMGDTTGRHWQTSSCRGRVDTVGFEVNSMHGKVGRVGVSCEEGSRIVQKPDFRKIPKEKRKEALDTYEKACENEDVVKIDVVINANQKFVLRIGGLEFRGEEIEKLNKLREADKTALDFAKNMLMEMAIHKAS